MTRRYTGGFLSATEQATDSNTANGIFTLQEAGRATAAGNFPTGRWTPQRSLRFRNSVNTYLRRTPSTTGNRKTFTHSVWVKRGLVSTTTIIFEASDGTGTTVRSPFRFATDLLQWSDSASGATVNTNAALRDPAAWYHFVVAVDTTQTISTDRVKMYINGVRQTSFETYTAPTLNADTLFNSSSYYHTIGSGIYWTGQAFDGYMSEFNHIDGQSLDASYFGMTDPETGTWVPKRYTGTYGTNGFYLPFSDNSAATAEAIGKNFAPLSNYLQYSEDFSNTTYWRMLNATITSNTAVAPDGTTTADTFTDNSTNAAHRTENIGYANDGWVFTSGKRVTISYYAKYVSQQYVGIIAGGLTGVTPTWRQRSACFDILNGTVSRAAEGGSQSSITSVGNGWYRISLTLTPTVTASDYASFNHSPDATMDTTSMVGTGKQTYIWGAQLNDGGLEAYSKTTTVSLNNWTPTNFSLSSGVTYDSMVDVPGIASVPATADIGGVVRGNYATLNPVQASNITLSNGNLNVTATAASGTSASTIAFPTSGKWYFEFVPTDMASTSHHHIGIQNTNTIEYTSETRILLRADGNVYDGVGLVRSINGFTTNDVIGIASDVDSGSVQFYKNGVANGAPFTGYNISSYKPYWLGNSGANGYFNFGQRAFAYTPPTGFKSLNSTNLPNPVIKRPVEHFDAKTYTGNGTTLLVGTTPKQTSAYSISKSIRLRGANNSWLHRKPVSSSNRTTWTWSAWIKRGVYSGVNYQKPLCAGSLSGGTGNFTGSFMEFREYESGAIVLGQFNNGTQEYWLQTSATGSNRESTKWHHYVYSVDTTQNAASERVKLYIDGVKVTSFSTATYPSQNTNTFANSSSHVHVLGNSTYSMTEPLDGHIAEVNFVDGSALTASSFGTFDANNNWVPQRYTGTYGTNGYYLPFSGTPATAVYGIQQSDLTSNYFSFPSGSQGTNFTFSGDFTIEGYVYYDAMSGDNSFYVTSDGTNYFALNISMSAGTYNIYLNNNTPQWQPSHGLSPKSWNHIALVRSGSTMTLYTNGQSRGTYTSSATLGYSTMSINRCGGGVGGSRYMSNLRITKSAVYTTNFTPPTGNLTNIANTILLTCQSATAVDNSSNGYTVTNNGTTITSGLYVSNAIGTDGSGSYNNLSLSNISQTPGVNFDIMLDSPTDYDDGTNIRGNYATLNFHDIPTNGSFTITNGGLTVTSTSDTNRNHARATLGVSTGKWYWEISRISGDRCQAGVANKSSNKNEYVGYEANGWGIYQLDGNTYNNQTTGGTSYGSSWGSANDILMIALDMDNKKMWFGKNGTWFASGNPATGANPAFSNLVGEVYPAIGDGSGGGQFSAHVNFGQRDFTYTAPTGFKSINTKNLKDVGSYNLPDTFGNFVNTPDLVWAKVRSTTGTHVLSDTVRGPNRQLFSNSTAAQTTSINKITGFSPNSFQLGPDDGTGTGDVNYSGSTYVGWSWNRGKIPGFDIVQYGGNGAGTTFNHNLGVTPDFVVIKRTDAISNWIGYHKGMGVDKYFYLAQTAAFQSQTLGWIPTPNSFTITQNWTDAAAAGETFVAYLWAEVPGFSKFGTYIGNNSTNGPFVYCGFKPKYVMFKRADGVSDWAIIDTTRNPFNPAGKFVYMNNNAAEENWDSGYPIDILSNGFKLRQNTGSTANVSGATNVFMAFAENPFKYSNAG